MIRQDTRHILIVDDDAVDTEFLVHLIGALCDGYSYRLYTAKNADEAIGIYARNPIECAFIDYNMPITNGIDLVAIFNSLPSHISLRARFPVIVMSSLTDEKLAQKAKEVDAFGYISKRDLMDANTVSGLIDHMLSPYEAEKKNIA